MWLDMLKPNSRLILKAIADRCPTGGADLRVVDIAQAVPCGKNTVRRHIRKLDAWGYIAIARPGAGFAFHFQVLPKAQEELN